MHSLRSAAVQYTNYGTGGAFELPTQSGTFTYTLCGQPYKAHTTTFALAHILNAWFWVGRREKVFLSANAPCTMA